MIVDLMRNDLSRIARTGTVKVPELFKVTPFRSLFQMTSRVSIESDASLSEIMNAVYPPGSITGAPKIRAMEIIQELEDDARGVYTGSMAWFEPNGNFTMNVAIRTLVFNGNNAELGLGSGVVADSDKWPEWEECLLKGDFLKSDTLPREIFETALLENGHLLWLPEHLKRLRNSCRYFKRPFPRHTIFEHIREGIRQLDPNTKYRCRLAVDPFGRVTVTSTPLDKRGWQKKDLKLRLSKQQLNSLNPLLYHKTDKREIYNEEFRRAAEDGFDEVLFFNEKQEICEGAISNIVIEKADGCKITPALRSGLLPGIWRQHQLNEQKCREDVITIDELRTARSITIGNSFRLEGHVSEIIDADGETIFTAK